MKTLTKTILALASVLLVAGCSAAAQDDTTAKSFGPGYGPGWRHEQMVQAREKGELPGPMMRGQMRGPGMRGPGQGMGMGGMGPGAAAIGPDGKVDTTKLPDWCPYKTAPDTAK